MKKTIILLVGILIIFGASAAWAQRTTVIGGGEVTRISTTFQNGLGISYVKYGTQEAGVLYWHPNLRYGPFGMALDVNVPLGEKKPTDLESVVVRYLEYDTGTFGARYGVLSNVSLGRGLLMSNYSTTVKGSSILSNQQTGLKAYWEGDLIGFEALGTWSRVYGVRLTEKVHPRLILGQSYVTDADGVTVTQTDGSTKSYPAVSGYGVDAEVPLWPGADLYAEYARLSGHGSGISAGFGLSYDLAVFKTSFKAERRFIEANFVPGYFNAQYEINPIDLASSEATGQTKDGYLAELSMAAFGRGNLLISYEDYLGSNPTLAGEAFVDIGLPWWITAYFRQPNFEDFRSLNLEQGAIIGGSLGYKINPYTSLITHYKKAYDPVQGRVVESTYYEVEMVF